MHFPSPSIRIEMVTQVTELFAAIEKKNFLKTFAIRKLTQFIIHQYWHLFYLKVLSFENIFPRNNSHKKKN